MLRLVDSFAGPILEARDEDELFAALLRASFDMGFDYVALSHHVDMRLQSERALRMHNYPPAWERYYDEHGFGTSDPVRRASDRKISGFLWTDMPQLIAMTRQDHETLDLGQAHGIGTGYTVPANVPGQFSGSCTFAVRSGRQMPLRQLPLADLVGKAAFDAAYRIQFERVPGRSRKLTGREHECVRWTAAGKSDWETGRILGISEETATKHVRKAMGKLDVYRRTPLAINALYAGFLTYADIIPIRWKSHNGRR